MAKFSFCQMTQSITAYWHHYFNSREFYNCVARNVCVCVLSISDMSDSLQPHGL